MNSIFVIMFATASLIISGYALAVDVPAEDKAKCGTCHAIDKHIFGPSFMAVSEKYKGDKDAASKIATIITLPWVGRLAGYWDPCWRKAWVQMILKSDFFQSLLLTLAK